MHGLPELNRRRIIFGSILVLAALVGLYFLIPKLAGLNQTWGQLKHGDPVLLVVGGVLELLSVAGYAVLFRTVFGRGMERIDWRASLQIPLAGIAAIRLLSAAGAGGVAVTVGRCAAPGWGRTVIACRMVASYVIQYSIYLGALIVCGLGLWFGVFPGGGSFGSDGDSRDSQRRRRRRWSRAWRSCRQDFERRLERLAQRSGRIGRLAARSATAPGDGRLRGQNGDRAGSRAAARAARGGRLLGVRHRRPRALVPGVQRGPAGRGPDHGLLPRHAREPAAAAGGDRRHRGRDDRGVRGVRRPGRPRGGRGARLPGDLVLASDDPRDRGLLPAAVDRPRVAGGRR